MSYYAINAPNRKSKINGHFKQLDKKSDILSELRKPYKRRKETLYDGIERIIQHRHLLIHNSFILPIYQEERVKKDIEIIEIAVKKTGAVPNFFLI